MHYNDQGADFKYLIVNERDKRFRLVGDYRRIPGYQGRKRLSTTQPPGRLLFHSPERTCAA